MSKNCTRCGTELEGKKRFCVYCGQIQPKPPFGELLLSVLGTGLMIIAFLIAIFGSRGMR